MRLAWVGFLLAITASTSLAQTVQCQVDTDCNSDNVCGGKVCNWYLGTVTNKLCEDATGAAGEGWCSGGVGCKCAGQGALCSGVHCTFTRPQDAPDMTAPPPDLLPPPPDLKAPPDLTPRRRICCRHRI